MIRKISLFMVLLQFSYSEIKLSEITYKEKIDSLSVLSRTSPERAIRYGREILEQSFDGKKHPLEHKVLNTMGEIYLELGLHTEALSYFIDSQAQLMKQNKKGPWHKVNIGNAYYQQEKYMEAKEYYIQALEIFESWDKKRKNAITGRGVVYSNLGRIELKVKNYDKALTLFQKALKVHQDNDEYKIHLKDQKKLKTHGSVRSVAYHHLLIASLYTKWEQYDLAMQECLVVDSILNSVNLKNRSKNNPFFKVKGNNFSEKTTIYTKEKKFKDGIRSTRIAAKLLKKWPVDYAQHMLVESKFFIQQDSLYLALESLDRGLKMCVINGLKIKEIELLNYKMELLKRYKLDRSALDIAQKIVKKNKFLHESRMSSLFNSMEYKSELLSNRERMRDLKSQQFVALIIIGFIFIILGFFIISYRNKKKYADQKEIVAEQEKKLIAAKLKGKENELVNMSAYIVSKNDLLNSILGDVDYYTSLIENKNDQRLMKPLQKKIQNQIDDAGDWEHFQDQFSSAYPEFVETLKRQFSDLRLGDIKLCCYLKMNMNTKEMARASGLSVRAIENKRYRLRKKLKLGKKTSLEAFMSSIKVSK